ncbi:MAG: arsenate reductase ArsC [Clostridia bacterium]|nr:arsenate reductase ArsC [Spirochaetia bacterium]
MTKVLFLCVHNSARSQMAEAYLNKLAGERFAAESAGLEPGKLNPFVVRALSEDGLDIAEKETRSVFDLFKAGKRYEIVVTVCDKEAAERCPIFPGLAEKLHWPFPDPSRFAGTEEEIMARTREVRDMIKTAVGEFIASRCS